MKTYTVTLRRYIDEIGGKRVPIDEPDMLYGVCKATESDFRQFVPGPVTESCEFWRRVLDHIETAHSLRLQESMAQGKNIGQRERARMIAETRLVETISKALRGPGEVVENKPTADVVKGPGKQLALLLD